MKVCIVAGLAINLTISGLMFIFGRQMMGVFTSDPEVINIGVTCLSVIMPIQWWYIMTSVHLAMLQAIKRPIYGFFESMLRKVLLPVPLFALFVWQWQLPVEWIWYAVAELKKGTPKLKSMRFQISLFTLDHYRPTQPVSP